MTPSNPDDLERIDQEIRINELKHEIDEATGEAMTSWTSPDCPPEMELAFLERVKSYEEGPWTSSFEQLRRANVDLPEPQALTDVQLTAKLWEVIHALAKLNTFLSCTDHLNDRELYTHLWEDALREEMGFIDPALGGSWHIDILGGCSDEDIHLHLKHYANEEYRQRWAKQWPNEVIPPHEDPPYDRDRRLPKSELG